MKESLMRELDVRLKLVPCRPDPMDNSVCAFKIGSSIETALNTQDKEAVQ